MIDGSKEKFEAKLAVLEDLEEYDHEKLPEIERACGLWR